MRAAFVDQKALGFKLGPPRNVFVMLIFWLIVEKLSRSLNFYQWKSKPKNRLKSDKRKIC